ncbi:MAG: hypothetical protein AMXMBFR53_12980 [Gemmatimonadota bacterium]
MTDGPRLRPREHGAYAMLAFPAVSGLVLGGLSWAGVGFIGMAVTGFMAHESVLVVLGARGARIRSSLEGRARARLLRLAAVFTGAAAVFSGTARPEAWPPALVSGGLAVGVALLLLAGRTRTLRGELLVAATFASVHGVVAAAGGSGAAAIWTPVVAWIASFGVATLSVHALKVRFKGRGPGGWTVVAAPALGAAILALAAVFLWVGHPMGPGLATVMPKAGVAMALGAVAIHPRHLRRVGWTLVAADGLTLFLLVAVLG